jgi:bifunctional enzyme CysN/CysC
VRYGVDITTMRKAPIDVLEMNGVARCTITPARPLAIDPYRNNRQTGAFILIDRLSNRTVAAGVIVDRRAQEIEIDDAAPTGDTASVDERATS